MTLDKLSRIEELEAFLKGSQAITFTATANKAERYQVVEALLRRFCYSRLKRQDKGVLIRFLMKITGYSRQQLTRMIQRFIQTGQLKPRQKTLNGFDRVYSAEDVKRLAELDKLHDTPNGLRAKKLCERAYNKFEDQAYKRLANISVSHLYNLRRSSIYHKHRRHFEKTKSHRSISIGERRKPRPQGKPGYIRIDTVHQGDLDRQKGVYHINAVDEVTQFEMVASVEKISEAFLLPVLSLLLDAFPFKIINFHSDNGSEYVNKTVAKLLGKLLIEFTKSRPRTSNDNALAEGKNAAVVRKIYGYAHIPQRFAKALNAFNNEVLNPYVNYHRPCLYPTTQTDSKGKQIKSYLYQNMMTPYEKLKSLPNASQYLKEGVTFKILDDLESKMSDNQAAELLQKQRKLLFKNIHEETTGCS
mgnify:CR=1 FL=1